MAAEIAVKAQIFTSEKSRVTVATSFMWTIKRKEAHREKATTMARKLYRGSRFTQEFPFGFLVIVSRGGAILLPGGGVASRFRPVTRKGAVPGVPRGFDLPEISSLLAPAAHRGFRPFRFPVAQQMGAIF
jgi:hypothetical protein